MRLIGSAEVVSGRVTMKMVKQEEGKQAIAPALNILSAVVDKAAWVEVFDRTLHKNTEQED